MAAGWCMNSLIQVCSLLTSCQDVERERGSGEKEVECLQGYPLMIYREIAVIKIPSSIQDIYIMQELSI